jgi:hypothetical protein
MSVKSTTSFVEADSNGFYTPPEGRPIDRIRAITATTPRVDQNGRIISRPGPDPSVVETVIPTEPAPTMADALAAAAEAVGADLPTLLASQSFCAAITPVSPSDQAELQAVVRDHMAAPAAPGMAPVRAQGAPGAIAPGPATGSVLERMHDLAEKALTQPEPPSARPFSTEN